MSSWGNTWWDYRNSVSESLTPPGCRPGGLAADRRPARTARRRGTVWTLTSSLWDGWNPARADIHPLESPPSSRSCSALRTNTRHHVQFDPDVQSKALCVSLPVWLDQKTNRRLQGRLRTWDNFLSSSHEKHGSETQTSDKETAEFQYYCNFPPIMSEEERIWHHTED